MYMTELLSLELHRTIIASFLERIFLRKNLPEDELPYLRCRHTQKVTTKFNYLVENTCYG